MRAELDAIWQHMRFTEAAWALEAKRHRREVKAIAVALLAGLAVAAAILYLERAAVIPDGDLGPGSAVWTIAVAGLAVSAIGQLAIVIARYRRSLSAKFDLPPSDRSLPAE